MNVVLVYGVIDPRSFELFYVGKTSHGLAARKRTHIRAALNNEQIKSARTIRGILAAGLEPDFFVIEPSDDKNWVSDEQFWIAYFRSIGCNLANHTAGGEGLSGHKHKPDAIAKMIAANLGRPKSDECRAKIKASWTDERKAKHVASCRTRGMPTHQRKFLSRLHKGKTISEQQKRKISNFFRGRSQSEEQKRKSGEGVRASWTDDRRKAQSDRMKAIKAAQTHCKRGHPLSGDNLRMKGGRRVCRECGRAWARANRGAT